MDFILCHVLRFILVIPSIVLKNSLHTHRKGVLLTRYVKCVHFSFSLQVVPVVGKAHNVPILFNTMGSLISVPVIFCVQKLNLVLRMGIDTLLNTFRVFVTALHFLYKNEFHLISVLFSILSIYLEFPFIFALTEP